MGSYPKIAPLRWIAARSPLEFWDKKITPCSARIWCKSLRGLLLREFDCEAVNLEVVAKLPILNLLCTKIP